MAKLDQADRPIAALVQVIGELVQDSIGVLVLFIDQRRKVALGVEHGGLIVVSKSERRSRHRFRDRRSNVKPSLR